MTGDPCSSTVVPVSCVRCSVLTPIHFVMPFSSVSYCVLTPMGAPNEGGCCSRYAVSTRIMLVVIVTSRK